MSGCCVQRDLMSTLAPTHSISPSSTMACSESGIEYFLSQTSSEQRLVFTRFSRSASDNIDHLTRYFNLLGALLHLAWTVYVHIFFNFRGCMVTQVSLLVDL
jgi:hypothetical protein